MKAYICDKLTSSVNGVKFSNAVVSEFLELIFKILLLFRLFTYKVLVEFNMLGKARKNAKTKTAFEKKRICNAIVGSFNFLIFSSPEVSCSVGVNKIWIDSKALCNGVRISRLLGFFLQQEIFHRSPYDILLNILAYSK